MIVHARVGIKAGSQYDAKQCVALCRVRVDTCRNTTRHQDRLGSYPCVSLRCTLASGRQETPDFFSNKFVRFTNNATQGLVSLCEPAFTRVHAIMLYTSIYLSVYRALPRTESLYLVFRRLVSRSGLSGSVPRYCYALPPWQRHRGSLVFRSGTNVTGLPQIQSSIQPVKIKKQASKLNCHEESTQDEEFVARTQLHVVQQLHVKFSLFFG